MSGQSRDRGIEQRRQRRMGLAGTLLLLTLGNCCTKTPAVDIDAPPHPSQNPPQTHEDRSSMLSSLELHFQDASIPPEYHRSFYIRVNSEQVQAEVDVYGTIIAKTTVSLAPDQFQNLAKTCADLPSTLASGPEPEITGAQIYRLKLFWRDRAPSEFVWRPPPGAPPRAQAVAEDVKALVPSLQNMLETPYVDAAEQ